MTSVRIRKEQIHRGMQRKEGLVRTEAEIGVNQLKFMECQGLTGTIRSLKRSMEEFFPKAFKKAHGSAKPPFWTCSFQNCERINVVVLNYPDYCSLL